MKWYLLLLPYFCFFLISCVNVTTEKESEALASSGLAGDCAVDTAELPFGIYDLIPGDIIVRANNNWLPGSAFVPGGYTFGHAAIVIRGSHHPNTDSLLAGVLLMESNSRDVDHEDQVRIVPGYYTDPDPDLSNHSFGPQYAGIRFRLRIPLTAIERDSLVAWVMRQDKCGSSWRAMKEEGRGMRNKGQKTKDDGGMTEETKLTSEERIRSWYCTLLIRAAFLHIKGIDLDANHGWIVYPNDLIASRWFDNKEGEEVRRTRF